MKLTSWGRYPVVESHLHYYVTPRDITPLLQEAPLIAYGNGRSYGDSALGDHVLMTRDHDRFIAFDETRGILHIEAGVLLSEIIEAFVPKGWFLSVTPGTKLITVGGAIASDVHGKNHHVKGCFSDCVTEFTLLTGESDTPVTCSKEATPELFAATCGGMGLTGVILDARIVLQKINSAFIDQVTFKSANLRETFELFEAHKGYTYSVAWIDCLASGDALGRSLLMVGEHADDGDLSLPRKKPLSIPFTFPSFALNSLSVRAFNMLYYGRIREKESRARVSIDSFFYPLDAIGSWNRIYGKSGFTQYQFVLPKAQSFDGLSEILGRISASGMGSFLAVLKLFGPGNDNWLSFPTEGYTLALDFKIEPGLFELLDELDAIVVRYGGRLYLTKDVRVSREVFEQGYDAIERFRTYRRDQGMDARFASLQSQRLEL